MNTEITYTTVDTDALDFLKAIYFGVTTNAYEAAGRRAYLDLNRTIRFNGMAEEKRNELRASVIALLEKEIRLLSPSTITNQVDYDAWHRVQCTAIRSLYRDNDIEFYYGQSQKWLNMMIKYLYMLGECTFDGIFGFLHVPLEAIGTRYCKPESIPPERIEKIENERVEPHPEEIWIMAEKYKAPALCNFYCTNQCPIGQRYVPEVKIQDLSHIILRMIDSLHTVQDKQRRLISNTADRIIDDS